MDILIQIGLLLAALAFGLVFLQFRFQVARHPPEGQAQEAAPGGFFATLLAWARAHHLPGLPFQRADAAARLFSAAASRSLVLAVELGLLLAWALMVGSAFLDLDSMRVPAGHEYLSAIQSHHLWTRVRECGACAFWDGSTRGGSPAFADIYGSMLHPLVIVTTLVWGVLNGSKIALIGALFLAGLSQWLLARVLGLGQAARLWSAGMAVAGGHLAARLELGLFGILLSTATCALALPALLLLSRARGNGSSRRAAVLLGIALALALLSGQGYMQIGLVSLLPVALLLVDRTPERLHALAGRLALAGLIAFLLAAPFLAPFLHFLPQFSKDITPEFEKSQALEYIPLNLLIRDHDFYWTDSLKKPPVPSLNANFIGWAAVLLAAFALQKARNPEERRAINFLAAGAALIWLLASGMPLKWAVHNLPFPWVAEMAAGVRHPGLIAGLAVPLVLGLSAIGLDRLIGLPWPRLYLSFSPDASQPRGRSLPLQWLLVLPLLLALKDAHEFGKPWLAQNDLPPFVPVLLDKLKTNDLQWINPPFGDHYFIEMAAGKGLKMSYGVQPWFWKNRTLPLPVLMPDFHNPIPEMDLWTTVADIPIYKAKPGREYARVAYTSASPASVCAAFGTGGNIDVSCSTREPGVLTVLENRWSGWQASVDGHRVALKPGLWLSLDLPPGDHTISFRYRPWDVPLGLFLCLVGIGLAVLACQKSWPVRFKPPFANP